MSTPIFQFRMTKNFRGLDADRIEEATRKFTKERGKVLAGQLLQRLRKFLSPGYKMPGGLHPVGASGEAQKNLFIRFGTGEGKGGIAGFPVWYVEEGDKTPANRLIREGVPKGNVSIERLRQWSAQKRMSFGFEDDGEKKRVELKNVSGYTTKSGRTVKTYVRGKGGSRGNADRALYAIRTVLRKYGTMRDPEGDQEGPNWLPLRPKGKGRFDYIQELLISDRDYINNWGAQNANELIKVIRSGLQSSQKRGWTRPNQGF